MADTTKIQWTDKTWSPWQGCTKVGPGCDHCYAEALLDTRLHKVQWGAGQPRVHTVNWDSPRRWNKQAAKDGHRIKVFPSICDPFDNEVPDDWRTRFFRLIEDTPNLDWLLLTKRIGNASKMIDNVLRNYGCPFAYDAWPWPNVWIGATVVNQEEADRDIPKLLATPAAKRFISYEPALEPVDLRKLMTDYTCIDALSGFVMYKDMASGGLGYALAEKLPKKLDWVIAGGESGPKARPAHPDWFRSLRDQCASAVVPFFMKQMTKLAPIPSDLFVRQFPEQEVNHAV